MPAVSKTLSGQYGGNFKEASAVIPNTTPAGYPVSGVPALNQLTAGSVANVIADINQPTGTGTLGANGLVQYGYFTLAAPTANQLAQGYLQVPALATTLATNMWLPTNSCIINFDIHCIIGFNGTLPTLNLGAANANNGTGTFFLNALPLPATAQQVQTQGSTTYQCNNFTNTIFNPTGVPTASTALNTTVSGITQPVFNLTLQFNGTSVTTGAIFIVCEYVYFGSQGPTGASGV